MPNTIVTPDEGQTELMDKMLKAALTVNEDYLLDLYKNNYVPVQGSTGASFTVSTFGGYSQKTLTRSGFNAAANVADVAVSVYGTDQVWTCTSGSETAYGYLIRGATSGKVLWAQAFDTPRSMSAGAVETLTVRITGQTKV